MSQTKHLFHGTSGDNLLAIIRSGKILPDRQNVIFFSEHSFDKVLMHGGDSKRKASFAACLKVSIPDSVIKERGETSGVRDTIKLVTKFPLNVEVVELYVRRLGLDPGDKKYFEKISGQDNIKRYLESI